MKRIKEGLTKAGIPYVSECLGGNIEGVRIGSMYIVEHGSGEGYYFGNLEESSDTCYTLEEVFELAKEEVEGMKLCYRCDGHFKDGYWLKIEGEEDTFYCSECMLITAEELPTYAEHFTSEEDEEK